MAWHGNCYKLRTGDTYPIVKLDEIEGIVDPEEDDKFKTARNGDHLVCPFQCDLCHFRNIQSRDPRPVSRQDKNLMIAIRRANLDGFWGRSSSTIKSNKSNLKRFVAISQDDYGIKQPLPNMGPHELNGSWGMGLAVGLLRKSLDKGVHGPTVQFQTARRLRSAYSNLWGASLHALTLGVLAKDTTKIFVTSCPGYCLWFERFVRGMHSRMGDIRKPDAAISNLTMHAVMDRVEADFIDADSENERRYLARCGLYFMAGYLGSLRGEEIPRILLKYFLELNEESLGSRTRHCVLPLYGNFKNDGGISRCYLFRIVCQSKTGFNMEKWVRRAMEYESESKTAFLFAFENGKREYGQIYEPYFISKLKSVQREERGILPKKLDVEDAFGVSRSFRRGSVTAAGNAPNDECDEMDIKRNNRWRTEDSAGTKNAGLDMLQLYTDTLHSVEADLKFSTCL